MLVPSMLTMADVMTESDYTEEQVFDLGIAGELVFLAVVPELGACRVPVVALSHFMAGADDYTAEGMTEHYSGALSGPWKIKHDRLRILPQSWEIYSRKCLELATALDFANPTETGPSEQGKKWTTAFTDEVRAYRAKHTEKQTSENYGVSGTLIRRKLAAPKKAKAQPFSGLGSRAK